MDQLGVLSPRSPKSREARAVGWLQPGELRDERSEEDERRSLSSRKEEKQTPVGERGRKLQLCERDALGQPEWGDNDLLATASATPSFSTQAVSAVPA